MQSDDKEHIGLKTRLHARNLHRTPYDFDVLIQQETELSKYISLNRKGARTIDFADPKAVKLLNSSLLKAYYDVDVWQIPEGYLCPPVPGRADYVHHISDLLGAKNYGKVPHGQGIKCLDIGVGANCIYPIIGHAEYGWSFVGADCDPKALEAAQAIIDGNVSLIGHVQLRRQHDPRAFFSGIISDKDVFDLTLCNPPFHKSHSEAMKGTVRKNRNLHGEEKPPALRNFGGQNSELCYEGGERQFISGMIKESVRFGRVVHWFTTLVAKAANVKAIYADLKSAEAREVKTIPIGQGNKGSRIIAWTFLFPSERRKWADERWRS
ncbi:UNVERIFIED_CONTAM: hypothetical protein GTU68_028355 [Idotea baltica]|nr:hypothetical protein [Idotea baltica]